MSSSKPRSGDVTDGDRRAPARAMLRAVGMTDEDIDKPQIGVAERSARRPAARRLQPDRRQGAAPGRRQAVRKYVMTDIDRIGGVPVVMKALLDADLLHGDVLTCTGKTMAENLAEMDVAPLDGQVIRALGNPMHKTGG